MTVVTGATGFVGSALVRQLLAAGERVRILRRASSALDLLGDAADAVEHAIGDVTDPDAVYRAVDGAATVYHVAAVVAFGRRAQPRLREVNVGGTATVVNAALAGGVGRLVHTSSIAALGRTERPTGIIDEQTAWVPSRANTDYALSKRDAEREVLRGIAEGLDAVIVNPAVVFGPGRAGEGTFALAERVAAGRALTPPGGTAVVDVEDVASGLRCAHAHGERGERYILAAENRLWADILGEIAEAAGAPRPRTAPAALLTGAGALAEAWSALSRSEAALTRAQARNAAATYRYDASLARRDLGWTARPFAETARRTAAALAGEGAG